MARRTKLAIASVATALVATMGAAGMATSSDAAPTPHYVKRDSTGCC
jgi:hypothetical protein